jgi:hypothetical protein
MGGEKEFRGRVIMEWKKKERTRGGRRERPGDLERKEGEGENKEREGEGEGGEGGGTYPCNGYRPREFTGTCQKIKRFYGHGVWVIKIFPERK